MDGGEQRTEARSASSTRCVTAQTAGRGGTSEEHREWEMIKWKESQELGDACHTTERREGQLSCPMVSHATESNPHGDTASRATTELHGHLDSLAAQQPMWTAQTLNTVLPEQPAKPLLFGRHREMMLCCPGRCGFVHSRSPYKPKAEINPECVQWLLMSSWAAQNRNDRMPVMAKENKVPFFGRAE